MMEKFVESIKLSIDKNRFFYYGIAILLIVLCHSNVAGINLPFLKPFSAGYIGVDLFFFFSVYGCSFSYERNDIIKFYRRRLLRIFPLFFLFALLITFIKGYESFSVWDWICNLTTLSYWHLGGRYVEWYLSALLLVYLIFPLLFRFVKGTNILGYIIVLGLTFYILYSEIISDAYIKCFISRWPAICLGILWYCNKDRLLHTVSLVSIIQLAALFLAVYFNIKGGVFIDLISPLLIIGISLVQKFIMKSGDIISTIGKYSLEIYLANMLSLQTILLHTGNEYSKLLLYLIQNIVYAIIIVMVNKYLINKPLTKL